MHVILGGLASHPALQTVVIGMEEYPTSPGRQHYHMVIAYARRVHIPFEALEKVCGAKGNLRFLTRPADITAASAYTVKGCRGVFYPPSREAFVRRIAPKELHVEEWKEDQMKDMGGFEVLNGYKLVDHCQFWTYKSPQ